MPDEVKFWRTTYGATMNPSEMSHRHLSNIIWYFAIFWAHDSLRTKAPPVIRQELDKRFGGIQLPYQPLIVFKDEIDDLVRKGCTDGRLGSEVFLNGVCIGKITKEGTETAVFADVDGWKAIGICEHIGNNGPFWIYDSKGNNVAFLSTEGKFSLVEGYTMPSSLKLNDTGNTFDPETQLKQAVRLAYLLTQEPLNKNELEDKNSETDDELAEHLPASEVLSAIEITVGNLPGWKAFQSHKNQYHIILNPKGIVVATLHDNGVLIIYGKGEFPEGHIEYDFKRGVQKAMTYVWLKMQKPIKDGE